MATWEISLNINALSYLKTIMMVKVLKIIFGNLIVDTLFWLITVGLLIAWIINGNNNFTGFLFLVVGYIGFNIYNKVRLILNTK
jgi:hypothetical protein